METKSLGKFESEDIILINSIRGKKNGFKHYIERITERKIFFRCVVKLVIDNLHTDKHYDVIKITKRDHPPIKPGDVKKIAII
jgi:hypothetical protein